MAHAANGFSSAVGPHGRHRLIEQLKIDEQLPAVMLPVIQHGAHEGRARHRHDVPAALQPPHRAHPRIVAAERARASPRFRQCRNTPRRCRPLHEGRGSGMGSTVASSATARAPSRCSELSQRHRLGCGFHARCLRHAPSTRAWWWLPFEPASSPSIMAMDPPTRCRPAALRRAHAAPSSPMTAAADGLPGTVRRACV